MSDHAGIEKAARKAIAIIEDVVADDLLGDLLEMAASHAELMKWKADTINAFAAADSSRAALRLAMDLADSGAR